ncbi:hypothetical protein CISEMA079M_12815 [Citrobacter sedlakii]
MWLNKLLFCWIHLLTKNKGSLLSMINKQD